MYRFTIRTLLLVVTVACVLLALHAHRCRRQQYAIARLTSLDASCSSGPFTFEHPLSADRLRSIDGIAFSGPPSLLKNNDLSVLRELPNLRCVCIDESTHVSDDGLKHLAGLQQLATLSIEHVPISGDGLSYLTNLPNLTGISLVGTKVTDDALRHLSKIPTLTWIRLNRTNISDAGLEHLKALPQLRQLFVHTTRVTDSGLMALASLTNLTEISVINTRVSEQAVATFRAIRPDCSVSWYKLTKLGSR